MKSQTIIALLALTLAACAPIQLTSSVNATDAQNAAVSVVGTAVALTQTAFPTATPLPPTPTAAMMYPTPSPFPTIPPIIVITPDPIQVEKWETYQTELIKVVLPHAFSAEFALCEWVILGRTGQELYLYVICSGDEMPVVAYLNEDGSLQAVKAPARGSAWNSMIQELFPTEIQEIISLYYPYGYPGKQELYDHLIYRQTHRDVPPLIVLSAMSTATPLP